MPDDGLPRARHAWTRERQRDYILAGHSVDAQGRVRSEAETAVIARIAHQHAARCTLRPKPRETCADKRATDAVALAFRNYRNRPERKPAAGLAIDQNLGKGDVTNDRSALDCHEAVRQSPCRAQARDDLSFCSARMRGGKERFGNQRADLSVIARPFVANFDSTLAFAIARTLGAAVKGGNV